MDSSNHPQARYNERPLADGTTIQIAWTVLTIRRVGPEFHVLEPDYARNPFGDQRDDLSTTLMVLAQQTDVLRRIGVEGVAAGFDEKVVLQKGCLDSQKVYLERGASTPGDSGWYIGPVDGEARKCDYEAIYVYELRSIRPSLMQALLVPPGYVVVFAGEQIDAVLDSKDVDAWNRQGQTP